jgi:predicted nucleic acid-binding protein
MISASDTNIFVALWDRDHTLNYAAQTALESASSKGRIVVAAPVFAELLACPGRDEEMLRGFFSEVRISVDWDIDERIWLAAGRAYQAYALRRRRQREAGPRRLLTDFVIGAHAEQRGYALLTLDDRIYHAAFPKLQIVSV